MNNPDVKRPKVALVTSSGGSKAFGVLPLFTFLEEEGIEIDFLIGTSGGAIINTTKALGYSNEEIVAQLTTFANKAVKGKKLDITSFLDLANMPFGRFKVSDGLVKRDQIVKVAKEFVGDMQIEDLSPKVTLCTTDLLTGEPVALTEGPLAESLYATGCIYPMLAPIQINGRWLIDGAFSAPLPILEAVKQGADIIIAFKFQNFPLNQPTSLLEGFARMFDLGFSALERSQIALAVNVHHYEIITIDMICEEHVGVTDPSLSSKLIEWGAQAVERVKEEIRSAVAQFQASY